MSAGERTQLVFVRHGHPQAEIDRVVAGPRGCRGLSERGRWQAAGLGPRLRALLPDGPGAAYASSLPRARETAALALDGTGRVATVRADLDEMRPGAADGMSRDAAAAAARHGGPGVAHFAGGESLVEFDERVRRMLATVVAAHPGDSVVLFTHGGVIAAAAFALMGHESLAAPPAFRLDPALASITQWSRAADGSGPWRLERYNDV